MHADSLGNNCNIVRCNQKCNARDCMLLLPRGVRIVSVLISYLNGQNQFINFISLKKELTYVSCWHRIIFISQKRTVEDYSPLSCSIFISHKCIMNNPRSQLADAEICSEVLFFCRYLRVFCQNNGCNKFQRKKIWSSLQLNERLSGFPCLSLFQIFLWVLVSKCDSFLSSQLLHLGKEYISIAVSLDES